MLLKKPSKGKCLLNKLLNLNQGCMGPCRTYIPKTGYFHDKQKSSKANLRVRYFMLKMLQKAMYLDFRSLGQVTNINPKMQNFKRVLDLTWSKGSDLFNWLSNLKSFVLSPKNYKKSPSGSVLHPQTPISSDSWGLRFHALCVTCLSCTNLLTTSPNFDRIEKF